MDRRGIPSAFCFLGAMPQRGRARSLNLLDRGTKSARIDSRKRQNKLFSYIDSEGHAMPRVFLSHLTLDRQFVERELLPILHQQGIETWYAPTEIRTTEE